MIQYPVLLGCDSIELLAYPVDTAIDEKPQAMIALGSTKSRMKDFYDVWVCSAHLHFKPKTLLEAISATFKNRQTPIPAEEPQAFSAEFVRAHRIQWNAFVKKIGEEHLTDAFGKVIDTAELPLVALRGMNARRRTRSEVSRPTAIIG
jgi:Nucleotidyl transferase AbiEii toxin, Type IV TA system